MSVEDIKDVGCSIAAGCPATSAQRLQRPQGTLPACTMLLVILEDSRHQAGIFTTTFQRCSGQVMLGQKHAQWRL